jgi:LysM repeat protein
MAVDSVGDSKTNTGRSEGVSDVGGTRDVDTSDRLAADLDRDVDAVDPAEVSAEAAKVAGTDTPADTVERVGSYTVQRGDNLTHIARDHGVSLEALQAANPQVRNPDLIHPGQQLNLPEGARAATPGEAAPRGVPNPGSVNGLARGAQGQEVRDLQQRLTDLGYATGPVDGQFGPITQSAVRQFQMSNDLPTSGQIDDATAAKLAAEDAQGPRPLSPGEVPNLQVYTPGSPEQIALFREAARQVGLPEEWASDPGLINILRRESGGRVGVPNYTYGARANDPSQWGSVHDELRAGIRTTRSSATGLGQLLLGNVDRYYPSGRAGIGNPVEEAAGMMRYIQDRYGTPGNAWARYNTAHEGY